MLALLPLPLAHIVGMGAGLLLLFLPNFKLTWVMRRNLEICYPQLGWLARRCLYVRCLLHTGKAMAESPGLWAGRPQAVKRRLRQVRGWDAVQQALDAQQGVIVAAPHLGSWEMAGLAYSWQAPITSLYKPQKGLWEPLIQAGRQRFGAHLVPSDNAGVRALFKALKRGETTGILPDQDPPRGSGVFVPYFGFEAHSPVLPLRLATRTGAKIFIMFAQRLSFGRGFVLHFRPLTDAAVYAEDERTAVGALNLAIENVVREYPSQYWWAYQRFRVRRPGEPSPYVGTPFNKA